jgi:hypothetical protein
MRPRFAFLLAACAAVAWAAQSTGCTARSCTEMACLDGFTATFRTSNGAWPDGAYELVLRADQVETTCRFRLPEMLPAALGASTGLDCGGAVRATLHHESTCQSGCNGEACWQGCTPIPDKFVLDVSLSGTPSRIEISLLRDGKELAGDKTEPKYRVLFPNGPECGGACRQGSMEFAIPDARENVR